MPAESGQYALQPACVKHLIAVVKGGLGRVGLLKCFSRLVVALVGQLVVLLLLATH
jgi:hypothetical protein